MKPCIHTSVVFGVTFILTACMLGRFAGADGREPSYAFTGEPPWVVDATGFHASVVLNGVVDVSTVRVTYTYSGTETGTVTADQDAASANGYLFEIPAAPESGPGEISYFVEVVHGAQGDKLVRSEARTIPLALEKELDITGDAAIALLYPLGGPEYTVRYVPCCNIFGGVTIATRVPANPESTDAGLPSKHLSDFIVLKPDGLSASTMGMYFDFLLGAERMKGVTPVLYEFDGAAWVEFKSFEVDLATGRISMHCPNGGTFVVAAKP